MGLPLSSDSSTASSRARSWMTRAMRNKYLARSRPGIADHVVSNACRAALTARSTSCDPAALTSASTSSLAGLTVLNGSPSTGSTNSPLMNNP